MQKAVLISVFILITYFLCAQSGPAGVGNSSSNGLWLKADDINQTNNTNLATWLDASGNNNNANQATAGIQPLFFLTSSLNSMPIVRLDGTNDEMVVADSPILDGTSGITYYTVIRPNNLNGSPRGILGKRITFTTPLEYAYTWFFHGGNSLNLDVNTQNNRFNTGGTSFSNVTNYILSWDFDGTLAASQRSQIRTGSTSILRATESSTVVSASTQDLAIGALNVGYGTYLGADYGEIIHYNYALDTVDHILVQNYLSAKYNITIATNDLYDEDDPANGNYDFDVAGIGQISATEVNNDAQGSDIVRILNPSNLGNNEFLIWGHDNGSLVTTNLVDVPGTVEARFTRVWRVSEVNSSSTPVDVGSIDMRWDLTSVAIGSTTASDLRLLVDTDNDGVFSDEIPIAGATSIGGNIYEFAGITAIANNLRFTLGTIDRTLTPLPIELINFTAKEVNNNQVKLAWITATEVNNDYFTIERSANGNDWEIAKSVDGAGNSSTTLNYTTTDNEPYTGISYYRLKQTDFDGNFSYSDIRSVHINELVKSTIEIYPNPANNQVTLVGNKNGLKSISIYNVVGQNVTNRTIQKRINTIKMEIDISALSGGTYYVKSTTAAFKFYKQ